MTTYKENMTAKDRAPQSEPDGGNRDIRLNRLPAITWHRLRVNEAVLTVPDRAVQAAWTLEESNGAAIDVSANQTFAALKDIRTGAGEAFDTWIQSFGIRPLTISAALQAAPSANPVAADDAALAPPVVRLHLRGTGVQSQAAVFPVELIVPDGQQLTVMMDYTDSEDTGTGIPNAVVADSTDAIPAHHAAVPSLLAVQTRLKLGAGARLKLIQLQLAGDQTAVINDVGGEAGDDAVIETVQLFLGSAATYSGCEIGLSGEGSRYEAYIGYQGTGSRHLDFNYNAVHTGCRTESAMTVNGVLRDASAKTFRGTIDFQTGSVGAVGAETEDVLLLGEEVQNRTIPLILCAEEDVRGSHGASIGQLDEEMLFYLASRGTPRDRAVDLMAGARIGSIIRKIGDPAAEAQAEQFLGLVSEEA